MAVVTLQDIENYTGKVLTGPDAVAAQSLLTLITDEMEAYLGRTIEEASFTDTRWLYTRGAPRSYVPLTRTPVVSIDSVTVDGVSLDADQWSIERSGVELITVNFTEPLTGNPPQAVIVYTAGMGEPALSQLKQPILNRVARLMQRARDDVFGGRDVSVEGYRVMWQSDEWSDRELRVADRWKRRMISRTPVANQEHYGYFR